MGGIAMCGVGLGRARPLLRSIDTLAKASRKALHNGGRLVGNEAMIRDRSPGARARVWLRPRGFLPLLLLLQCRRIDWWHPHRARAGAAERGSTVERSATGHAQPSGGRPAITSALYLTTGQTDSEFRRAEQLADWFRAVPTLMAIIIKTRKMQLGVYVAAARSTSPKLHESSCG
jgi:hypothetical protein